MGIERSQEEIDEQRNLVAEQRDKGGTKWPGMTYEEGVENALAWVMGDIADAPMDD